MARSSKDPLSAARKLLSDARLLAFFRAAAAEDYCPQAIRMINRDLDKGESLDTFVGHFGQLRAAQGGMDLELKVKRVSPRVFTITYGLHGALVGDGGKWRVSYSAGAKVLRIEQVGFWIH
jgi:hypothetical protein